MSWQICIRYSNGQEKPLCSYNNCEAALKQIQAIYSRDYPTQIGYVVKPV
jgi:hypothetical protein